MLTDEVRGFKEAIDHIIKRLLRLEVQETPLGGIPSIISGRLDAFQSITSGSWQTIHFSEVVDTDDQYDPVTWMVTISIPGTYKISAQIQYEGSAAGGANQEERGIRLNGTVVGLALVGATADILVDQAVGLPPITLDLVAGDNFTFEARQESGGPLAIGNDAGSCYFTVECLRLA